MLSWGMQERFNRAGLGSYAPYLNPWETVARGRQYRDMERDFDLQDQVEDAEAGFMESIRENPKTGYQRFLQQNPLATLSPMVRAYVSTQSRMGGGSNREEDLAKLGAPYLQTYRQGVRGGKDELEAFADAVSQREQDLLKNKPLKAGQDSRLNLTGEPLKEYNSILSMLSNPPEPTDDEKMVYLPPGKKEYSAAEWSDAYAKAKNKAQSDAIGKLRQFQSVYGQSHKVPGVPMAGAMAPASAAAPTVSPWPVEAPTSFGTPPVDSQTAPAALLPSPAAQTQAQPAKATEFNFPTLGDDMAPSPTRQVLQGVKDAVGNVVSNVKFDPLQSLATAVQPGGIQTMATVAPPTEQQQNQEWTSAKQKVRDFISKIPGDNQQKLKILGSLLTEQAIPHDFFSQKKAADGRVAFVPAGSALQSAMEEADPKLGRTALKDKDGVKEWKDIARVVAQEEMAKTGLVRTPASSSEAPSTRVTTQSQYDALPSGTRYVDSNGRVAVKK